MATKHKCPVGKHWKGPTKGKCVPDSPRRHPVVGPFNFPRRGPGPGFPGPGGPVM
jgi:hypothetical protein